jgi:hypothetical protein
MVVADILVYLPPIHLLPSGPELHNDCINHHVQVDPLSLSGEEIASGA